jgi:hypothetical protein
VSALGGSINSFIAFCSFNFVSAYPLAFTSALVSRLSFIGQKFTNDDSKLNLLLTELAWQIVTGKFKYFATRRSLIHRLRVVFMIM